MKKKLLSVLLAIGMVAALVGCGGGGDKDADGDKQQEVQQDQKEDDTQQYETVKIRVAYMPNMGSAASLFVGIDQGFFEEVGLDVEVYEFQGGPAEITAMASGDIDIAQIGHGAHALCIEGQAVIFAMDHTTSLSDCVIANKEKGIEKAEDLKGKTIASSSGTSSEIILQQVLYRAGLTESDVNLVEMTVDGMTTAMISGQVDACAIWSPNSITVKDALGDNYVNLGGNADFLDSAIFPSSYITTKEYAEENEDILVRFGQALNKAHDWRAENIEEAAKILAKAIDAPEDTMLESVGEADWQTITEVCGDMDEIKTVYETQQKVFIDSGRIAETVDTNTYVLYDIMQKAYEAYAAAK